LIALAALAIAACNTEETTRADVSTARDSGFSAADASAPADSGASRVDTGAALEDAGVIVIDSGPEDTGAAAPDSGLAAFGAMCTRNEDCESGLCHQFGMRGQRCTYMCANGMCPIPNVGCNNMGVCRAP
jgi:hypothetical protein